MSYKAEFKGFKKELSELITKYKVGKYESDDYNGNEEYCGTEIYLTIDGEIQWSKDLKDIIKECIK